MEKSYQKKDLLALLVIPIEMILGNYLGYIPGLKGNAFMLNLASTLIFVAGFLTLITIYRSELKEAWGKYRQKLWLKLLLSVVLVVGAVFLLQFVRGMIPADLMTVKSAASEEAVSTAAMTGGTLMLATFIGALPSFISPFSEELVFRYLMIGKAKNVLLRLVMLLVQAVLFGLIHINNFGGNIYATIPYMAVGLYFGIIYLVFRNIWGSIMVHWIFNTMNGMAPALLMIVMQLLGVTN